MENARGIYNIYLGVYGGSDGGAVIGPSLSNLVAALDPGVDRVMRSGLADAMTKVSAIAQAAVDGEPFDQQIAGGNQAGNEPARAAVAALRNQTKAITKIANTLGIEKLNPETSDSFGQS